MPRNGSGTYSLPAGNPVVTGTTISSTVQNNTTADIAAALTASIAADGQTPPTANLPMSGFKHTNVAAGVATTDYARMDQVLLLTGGKLTGAIDLGNIGAVTAAATINLDVTTNIVVISGGTTISTVTLPQGGFCYCLFNDALTLTHGSSLLLPGSANATVVAGDLWLFLGFSGAVVVGMRLASTPANTRAAISAAASGANTDITSLSAPALGAATATTQTPATNNTTVATTAFVQATSLARNQTWQSLTGTRALTTAYTNTTDQPIAVSGFASNTGSAVIRTLVGGVNISEYTAASGAPQMPFFAIVPPGATYEIVLVSGTATLGQWSELRT